MNKRYRPMRTIVIGGAVVLASVLGAVGVASASPSSTPQGAASATHSRDLPGDPAMMPPRHGGVELTGNTRLSVEAAATSAVPQATLVHAVGLRAGGYVALMKTTTGGFVAVFEDSHFVVTKMRPVFGPRGLGGPVAPGDPSFMGHRHHGTPLTGATLASAAASAQAAVPGGTVVGAELENRTQGVTYEVHVKKTDGSFVKVLENASFVVTSTTPDVGPGMPGMPLPQGSLPQGPQA